MDIKEEIGLTNIKNSVSENDKINDTESKYSPLNESEEEPRKEITRFVDWKGVVMYGICVILASHFTTWTNTLKAGFWEVFGSMLIVGSATCCMMFCVAEMTAALPFSGGTYGVVRVTLGDFPGYLVGTCEVLQNVIFVAFNISTLGKFITTMTGYDEKYEPLYWAIIYISMGVISMNYRLLFWRSVWVFGVYICVILLLYCTMTRTGDVDFAKYTKGPMVDSESDSEHLYTFFEQLPGVSFFFNQYVKLMPLACRECKNPTTDVPLAMYIVYALAIMSAFSVLFCMSSIFPGVAVLRRSPGAPMSFGISSMFHIAMERAVAFTFLAKYATCLVYTFAFTQQMAALSKSGFLWNSRKWGCVPDRADRLVGLLVGCGFGYLLNMMIIHWHVDVRLYLVNGFKMLGYAINIVLLVTYIVFRQKFPSLMKKFRSPLGVAGAVYGLLVYIMIWSCIGALNDMGDHWRPFVLLACFLVLWSLPFVLYYRHHLTFSEEESSVLFVAYVIKANQARRLRRKPSGPRSFTSLDDSHNHGRIDSSTRGMTVSTSTRECSLSLPRSLPEIMLETEAEEGFVEEQQSLQAVKESEEEEEETYDLEEGGQQGGAALQIQAVTEPADPVYPPSAAAVPDRQQVPLRSSLKDSADATDAARNTRLHPAAAVRFAGVESRVAPTEGEAQDEGQQAARRKTRKEGNQTQVATAVQVLTRELGYGQEVLTQINTEFDEYLNTTDSQSQSSSQCSDGEEGV